MSFFRMDKVYILSVSLLSVKSQKKEKPENFQPERIFSTDLILQSISESICVIDQTGKIVFANLSAAKNLGYAPSEIIGKNYHETLFNRSNADALFCPIDFALTEGEISHVSTETFFRSDKSGFLVEYICVPLIENEQIIGAVVTFEDIAERRDVETAIAEARDNALKNARARADFLANMSHEIRTPLNGIIGTTDLLLASRLDQNQKNYAEMLKTSADLLLEIVNEILDFSKIEAGKLQLETVEFDFRKIIKETTDLFSTLAKNKNLTLNFAVDEKIPVNVFGDSSQLKQVLNNLLSNAVKFTEKGEVFVKISLREENAESVDLLFEIFDSGIGIEDEAQKYLFQPFTQADISTTRKFGGTGLGLAICRRIVEMMRGEIGFESRAGKGSRFWFTAMFAVKEKDSAKVKEAFENLGKVPSPKNKNRKLNVLVVEDNPISREIGKATLRQIGVEAEAAENGKIAVEICREKFFDLILMDCRMPEMDGFEAAQKIIGQSKPPKIPKIIALTASVTVEEREKCFAAGMIDFLTKPIRQNDLVKVLEKVGSEQNPLQNLDLDEKFVQHSLSDIIAPKVLENFLEIQSRGEENFVREMLDLYRSHTESGISAIKSAFSENNLEVIKQKAHSLKGSSGNIGIFELANFFENLEKEANDKNWVGIGEAITEIIERFKQIKVVIEKNYENG